MLALQGLGSAVTLLLALSGCFLAPNWCFGFIGRAVSCAFLFHNILCGLVNF
jgi:hypothetical protein